jgi:hypothetical protein
LPEAVPHAFKDKPFKRGDFPLPVSLAQKEGTLRQADNLANLPTVLEKDQNGSSNYPGQVWFIQPEGSHSKEEL